MPVADTLVPHDLSAMLPLIRGVVAGVVGGGRTHPDVDDCVQEVMRRALEGQSRVREGQTFQPWVIGIARHVAIDFLRTRGRQLKRTELACGSDEGVDIERLAARDPHAEAIWEREQTSEQVRQALSELPENTRTALELFHLHDLDYSEISRRMDVPMGTVATWIARGRRMLAQQLRSARVG